MISPIQETLRPEVPEEQIRECERIGDEFGISAAKMKHTYDGEVQICTPQALINVSEWGVSFEVPDWPIEKEFGDVDQFIEWAEGPY
jgi:hypothetical protein